MIKMPLRHILGWPNLDLNSVQTLIFKWHCLIMLQSSWRNEIPGWEQRKYESVASGNSRKQESTQNNKGTQESLWKNKTTQNKKNNSRGQSWSNLCNKINNVALDYSPEYKLNVHECIVIKKIIAWISKGGRRYSSSFQKNSKSYALDTLLTRR